MTLRSEPSGFTENTRLPLSSRTNKRPERGSVAGGTCRF